MNERQIAEAWQARTGQPLPLDERAEAALAAALFGGDAAQREAGLELLARLPQGPDLARVMQALAPDAAALSQAIAERRSAVRRPRRRATIGFAMAASAAAVAVLVAGLRTGPLESPPVDADGLLAGHALLAEDAILVASFEADEHAAARDGGPRAIFRDDFDS
jgi:hypothetical protein